MIQTTILKQASLVTMPFTYAIIPQFYSSNLGDDLLEQLPSENYYRSTRASGSDKQYNLVNNVLLALGESEVNPKSNLTPLWHDFVLTLRSEDYIGSMSELLKVNLAECYQEITLKRYVRGDYISPHTDTDKVRATHLLFLNTFWDENWGGQLQFLTDDGDILHSFLPTREFSAAFVRSTKSWHTVEMVQTDTERLALQIVFWNVKDKEILPGRVREALAY